MASATRREVPDRDDTLPMWGEVVKQVLSLMDALDDAEEALLRAYLRSGWDDIRKALSLIVRLKDANQ